MSRISNDGLKYPSRDGNVYDDYYDARSANKKWEQQQNILNELKRQNDIAEKQLQNNKQDINSKPSNSLEESIANYGKLCTLKGRSYPLPLIGKYHSCDGNNYDTMEEAHKHNREYWEQQLGNTNKQKQSNKFNTICWILAFVFTGIAIYLFTL